MPVGDWQFWVVSLVVLAAAGWLARGVLPVAEEAGVGLRDPSLGCGSVRLDVAAPFRPPCGTSCGTR